MGTPITQPAMLMKQATPTKSGRISSSPGAATKKYSQVPSASSELKELCRELFSAVKDCTDSHGRQLCLIFQKLPSRAEYPDYYTLIKKPIDMAKINTKLYGDQYQTLDDFLSDFQLMFDNACRYNEPDSQVYK
ncbi:PREDICTED: protein polybromo-1-like, partial [Acropora digitifera]